MKKFLIGLVVVVLLGGAVAAGFLSSGDDLQGRFSTTTKSPSTISSQPTLITGPTSQTAPIGPQVQVAPNPNFPSTLGGGGGGTTPAPSAWTVDVVKLTAGGNYYPDYYEPDLPESLFAIHFDVSGPSAINMHNVGYILEDTTANGSAFVDDPTGNAELVTLNLLEANPQAPPYQTQIVEGSELVTANCSWGSCEERQEHIFDTVFDLQLGYVFNIFSVNFGGHPSGYVDAGVDTFTANLDMSNVTFTDPSTGRDITNQVTITYSAGAVTVPQIAQ